MYGPGAGEKGVLDCPALLQFAMREAEAGQHCAASGCSCGWRGRGDILIPSCPATWRWCWCGVSRVIRGTVGLHYRATNSSGCPGPGTHTISHPTITQQPRKFYCWLQMGCKYSNIAREDGGKGQTIAEAQDGKWSPSQGRNQVI